MVRLARRAPATSRICLISRSMSAGVRADANADTMVAGLPDVLGRMHGHLGQLSELSSTKKVVLMGREGPPWTPVIHCTARPSGTSGKKRAGITSWKMYAEDTSTGNAAMRIPTNVPGWTGLPLPRQLGGRSHSRATGPGSSRSAANRLSPSTGGAESTIAQTRT
eukprot:scaffold123105_cov30-Tisochrysis_lutea.AAC.3